MKITNLMGNEYKGTIGKSITASKWKGRNYLKKWFKPTNPNSALQQEVRYNMLGANSEWHGFNFRQKGAYYWYQRYRKTNISPFNAMVGSFLAQEKATPASYTAPPLDPITVIEGGPADVEGALVILRKTGQATDYFREFSDAQGETVSSCTDEDEKYDIFITKAGYVPYTVANQTAVQICVEHTIVPI